ncbi:hypothetical protein ZWY2020_024760 [Hordeum vulgare]|nr:hypothetical protein ZWY2020_024760 [Hordeum vulgare]
MRAMTLPRVAMALLHSHALLLALVLLVGAYLSREGVARLTAMVVDVGVILDRTTWVGNRSWTCIELALEDFYADASHAGYRTRLKLHLRDTGPDAVEAASMQ